MHQFYRLLEVFKATINVIDINIISKMIVVEEVKNPFLPLAI